MATITVQEGGGGDYTALATALANANAGDVIEISGTWNNDDTSACIISDDNITINVLGASRHPGYWDETQNHYRLVVSGGSHCLQLNGAFTATIDGLAIEQASTTTSAECFRCIPGTADTATIKNCIFRCSTNTSQQDCLYTGFNTSIGDVFVEQCILYGAGRCGINSQNSFAGTGYTVTLHVNSCTIWDCGNQNDSGAGGIMMWNDAAANTMEVNVHNSIVLDCSSGASASDFNTAGTNSSGITWNISHSIDSDNTIASRQDAGTGTLASRTATDNTSPGAGDWVIFEDITTAPYDLRLVSNAENDAEDMHTTATAHSLTIPTTDIVGTTRASSYECGAYSLNVGSTDALTAQDIQSGTPSVGQSTLGQTHVLTSTDILSGTPSVEQAVLGQTHVLVAQDIQSGTPSVDQATLSEIVALTAQDIASGVPSIDAATLGQEHALTAQDVIAGTPSVDAATLGQTHVLVAQDTVSGTPTIEQATLGQEHALTAQDVTVGTPSVEQATLGQTHPLTAQDIDVGVPSIDAATLGQEHVLTASEIAAGTPTIEQATLGQEHALTAQDVTAGTPSVDTATLGQTHPLTAQDIDVGVPSIDAATLGQTHVLVAQDTISGVPNVDAATLGQTHVLVAQDVTSGIPSIEQATLSVDVSIFLPYFPMTPGHKHMLGI